MRGWMLLGCCTAIALHDIYQYIFRDQNHPKTGDQDSKRGRDTSFRSPPSNTSSSVHSSGHNYQKDPPCQSHRSRKYNYERCSNGTTSTSSTKRSQLQPQDGNSKSREETKPQPSTDQSKPVISQSDASALTSDQPRLSSAKPKLPAKESQSPSSFNNPPSSTPALSQRQSGLRNNKSTEGTKPPPSPYQSKPAPSQSSSLTSDQHRSSSVKAKPPATESQSPPSSKPTLFPLYSHSTSPPTKANYKLVDQKDTSPIYMIPKDIQNLIKKDIVPDVLKKPLSPATYKDYFAALLYAEDFYVEKWSNFQLFNVTLELHEAAIYPTLPKNKNFKKNGEKDEKIFVALKIDSVPERRPFLLSRDFVFARRSGSEAKKFQGTVYRTVKSNVVLVEFEEGFYSQHHRTYKYDIRFSFNRECLKRAHQAISAAASGSLLEKYLFPQQAIRKSIRSSSSESGAYSNHILDFNSISAVRQILSFEGHPPYLVEGPLCASSTLSKTGLVVQEAVLQIYRRSSSNCRILICAPLNNTGDILLRSFKSKISESVMFRVNAAFREIDSVPADILSSCVYEGECFSFPSLQQLKQFRVIFSTFVSSFRLLNEGITAGHFSHIFLVDASSATEPETMIPLSNLATENTTVILTGAPNNQTSWVRSDIARENGLRTSYFERLRATKIYRNSDPTFIMQL